MSTVVSTAPWSLSHLQDLQARCLAGQHLALREWSSQQLDDFMAQAWPTRRDELWKYTRLQALVSQDYTFAVPGNDAATIDIKPFHIADSIRLVFVNGYFSAGLSDLQALPASVTAVPLSAATAEDWQQLQPLLLSQVAALPAKFARLNAALITDGVHLHVADNTALEKPIHVLYVSTNDAANTMQQPRHLIQLGVNSSAQVFEEYVDGTDVNYLQNVVTQIHLADNAQLQYYKLQHINSAAHHMAHLAVVQQQHSRINCAYLANGGAIARDDWWFQLKQAGAHCQLNGLYLPQGQQHVANYSRIEHCVAHTSSQQHYRGVIADQAHAVFNGKVKVHPQAVQTDAQQSNHNLLLAPGAQVDTKPELEIYVDDVSCSHGATVGQLDEHALFYLQSRGIELNAAQHMLTCGFAKQVLNELSTGPLLDCFQRAVTASLTDNCQQECRNECS